MEGVGLTEPSKENTLRVVVYVQKMVLPLDSSFLWPERRNFCMTADMQGSGQGKTQMWLEAGNAYSQQASSLCKNRGTGTWSWER